VRKQRIRLLLQCFLYLGPLILWMAVIYTGSTQLGTYDKSIALMLSVARFFSPDGPQPNDIGSLFLVNNALRKIAHLVTFGILMLLVVRAIQWGRPRLKLSSLVAAILFCTGFSFSDALVRLYARDRHVRADQFVLNAIGSGSVLIITVLFFLLKAGEERLRAGNPRNSAETKE